MFSESYITDAYECPAYSYNRLEEFVLTVDVPASFFINISLVLFQLVHEYMFPVIVQGFYFCSCIIPHKRSTKQVHNSVTLRCSSGSACTCAEVLLTWAFHLLLQSHFFGASFAINQTFPSIRIVKN